MNWKNSMKQIPSWEDNSHTACQEILHFSWNLTAQYHVHKSLSLALILSHSDPVHNFIFCFLKSHFNTIFPFYLCCPIVRFFIWSFVSISEVSCACCIPHPFHPHWVVRLNNIWWRMQVVKPFIMQFYQLSVLDTGTVLSTLFSNTHNLVLSLKWETKFHCHTEQCTVVVLYILISMFLGKRWEDKWCLSDGKYSLNLICSKIFNDHNFYFLPSLPNIWTLPDIQGICWPSLLIYYLFFLHFGYVTWTYVYTQFICIYF
jgi:hypothetical protein